MKSLIPASDYKFLIIGGTSKAGTTSVFNYLANHPQICSFTKETRFFLDPDYPLPSDKRHHRNDPAEYLSLFDSGKSHAKENWRLEATPDYLHSPNTPRAIRETLPNVRLIFILREPISRLLSWYRFGQAVNEISPEMTFDDYVALQNEIGESFPDGYRHPAFGALRHGRYSLNLERFLEVFGASLIDVLFYEDLCRDPSSFISSICRSAGISEAYFGNYSFNIVNKTVQVRNARLHRAYFETKDQLRKLVRHTPQIRSVLRQVRSAVDTMYQRMNVTKSRSIVMSSSTEDFLSSYYGDEASCLAKLLGAQVPWAKKRPSGAN
jgi:hypothetical protein